MNWKKLDVLIGSPTQLENIIKAKNRTDAYDLNPKYLVIDEFDQAINDVNQFEALKFILRQFAGRTKSHLSDYNKKRTVVLSCASLLPRTLKTDTEELIKDWFPGIKIVKGSNYLKISPKIEHETFSVDKIDESEKKLLAKQLIDRYFEELYLKKSLEPSVLQSKKVLVFTNSSISTEDLTQYFN